MKEEQRKVIRKKEGYSSRERKNKPLPTAKE